VDDTGSLQEQLWQKYGVVRPGHKITSRVTDFFTVGVAGRIMNTTFFSCRKRIKHVLGKRPGRI